MSATNRVGTNAGQNMAQEADDVSIWGEGGLDTVNGNASNNTLSGGNELEADTLNGNDGDDTLLIQRGNDTLNGGADFDTARVANSRIIVDGVIVGGVFIETDRRGFIAETGQQNALTSGVAISLTVGGNGMLVGNNPQILDIDVGFGNFIGSNSRQEIDLSSFSADRGSMTVSSIERYVLTDFNDIFFGDTEGDEIDAGDGNDFIEGGAGIDTIDGGEGTDTASYQRSNESVGIVLDPTLNSNGLQSGGHAEGERLISIENLVGSSFGDFMIGDGVANDIHGQNGDDTISGRGGDDNLFGGNGDDTLSGGEGFDDLFGGDNDDVLNGGAAADVINGGNGIDTASFAGLAGAVSATLTNNAGFGLRADEHVGTTTASAIAIVNGVASIDQLISIENLIGTAFDDSLSGSSDLTSNRLEGRSGNDTLNGFGGSDNLFGGDNNDTLNGGTEADNLFGEDGVDILNGESGDDILRGGAGIDTLNGGSNLDTADFTDKTLAVIITLGGGGTGTAFVGGIAEDTLNSIENLSGGSGNDAFVGDQLGNVLQGNGGNDTIRGGFGFDDMDGGANIDTVDYSDKTTTVELQLDGANAVNALVNGATEDVLKNFENIIGGSAIDVLFGDAANNRIEGNGGGDKIVGGDGLDTLIGGADGDQISGGLKNDTIEGGTGNDRLFGDEEDDNIKGGDDADFLNGGAGKDVLDGEAGIDIADYSEKTLGINLALNGSSFVFQYTNGVWEDSVRNIENVIGGSAGDRLTGDSLVNELQGRGGNDILRGGGGLDLLDGGANSDTADYADQTTAVVAQLTSTIESLVKVNGIAADRVTNIENITSGSGLDDLRGDAEDNTFNSGGGNDFLKGGLGKDTLDGGTESDTADYSEKTFGVNVSLNGANFVSVVVGGVVEDRVRNIENINGGTAGDLLAGDNQINRFNGNGGNDFLRGGLGVDILDGGADVDTADYSEKTGAITTTLNGANFVFLRENGVHEDSLRNIENVIGGTGNDILIGDSLANSFVGNNGIDTLTGNGGDDTFIGGFGNDILDGGADIDTSDFSHSGDNVTLTLNGSNIVFAVVNGLNTDSLVNIENVIGGAGNDSFTGDSLVNILRGGRGDDVLRGGDGLDTLDGGGQSDTAEYSDQTAAVTVTLNGSNLSVASVGGIAADNLISIENIIGGSAVDLLNGDAEANTFIGNAGGDRLNGNAGNDTFKGGLGLDIIDGGADSDTADYSDKSGSITTTLNGANFVFLRENGAHEDSLRNIENLIGGTGNDNFVGDSLDNTFAGGLGNDTLNGAGGADTFRFDTLLGATNIDTIVNFVAADDTIALENLIFTGLANGVLGASNLSLTGAATNAVAQIIYNDATGTLRFDADGTGGGAAQTFANIGAGLAATLTVSDFFVT